MAFGQVQLPDINPLASYYDGYKGVDDIVSRAQEQQLGQQKLEAGQLALDYTRQTQPGQLNMMLGAQREFNDASTPVNGLMPTASPAPSAPSGKGGAFPVGGGTPFVAKTLPPGVTPELDQAVRTIVGEAGNESDVGQQAVGHVIKNRMAATGKSATDVIFAPNQFEPWNNPTTRARLESIDPASPEYQRALANARQVLSGAPDPTGGATHFFAPQAQAALGRQVPAWGAGQPLAVIGGHSFYRPGGAAPAPAQAAVGAPPPGTNAPLNLAAGPSVPTASGDAAPQPNLEALRTLTQRVLAEPTPAARAALYAQVLPAARAAGATKLPDTYPGDDAAMKFDRELGQQAAANVPSQQPQQAAAPVQQTAAPPPGLPAGAQPLDVVAQRQVRQLLAARNIALAMPDGKGVVAAADIQKELGKLTGPGAVAGPDGRIYQIPGAAEAAAAHSGAIKYGEIAPSTQLKVNEGVIAEGTHAANTAVTAAAARETARQEANIALLKQGQTPLTLKSDETVAPPSSLLPPPQLIPPGAAAGAGPRVSPSASGGVPTVSAPASPVGSPGVPGTTLAAGPAVGTGASPAATPTPPVPAAAATPSATGPTYRVPSNPANEALNAEAKRSVEIQQPIMDQAKESANALNRIAQVRTAIQQTSAAGIPPGKFGPALAESAAAAKSLGIDLSSLGIHPEAIQSQQVADEALTQINGEILKRMFPQRITNADVKTFGSKLATFGMDPKALDAIMNMAEESAKYDVNKANDMLDYKNKNGGHIVGWDSQFYQKHGYGPNLIDALNSGTVPGAPPAVGTAGQTMPRLTDDPAGHAAYRALPSGATYISPDGHTRKKP